MLANTEAPISSFSMLFDRQIQVRWVHAAAVLLSTALVAGAAGYFTHKYVMKSGRAGQIAANSAVTRLPVRTFGHWNLGCVQDAQGAKRCELVLRVVDANSQKLVLSLLLGPNAENKTAFVIVTPPHANTADSVQLVTTGSKSHQIGFEGCSVGSCRAVALLDDALQAELASSATLGIRYNSKAGREIHYDLPNDGFQDAFTAWTAETAG